MPATDDPGLTVVGWQYIVTEHISGGGRPPYPLDVPYDSAGIDLADVDAATNSPDLPLLRGSRGEKGDRGDVGPGAERNAVTAIASVGGSLPVDYSAGNYYTVALAENITGWDFNNLPGADVGITFVLVFTQGASDYSIDWPPNFDWGASMIPPDMPNGEGSQLVLVISSIDGGAIWDASARIRDS